MKRNMKKLLVIALALMPSLSINTFAQNGGGIIPPGSNEPIGIPLGGSRPRCLLDDPDGMPIASIALPDPHLASILVRALGQMATMTFPSSPSQAPTA